MDWRRLFGGIIKFSIGMVAGVVTCQFSYFEIEKQVSLSEIFIFLCSSLVAIYIADNVAQKLAKRNSVENLYTSDIKSLHESLSQLEKWLDAGQCGALELKQFLRNSSLRFYSIIRLYKGIPTIRIALLEAALSEFNDLKTSLTDLSPSNNGMNYSFEPGNQNKFRNDLEEVKVKIIKSLVAA